MKVYLIVEIDSYHFAYPTLKCFASKEKAEKYCAERNEETSRYLQKCADENKEPDMTYISKVKEIEVIEDDK